MTNSTSHSTDNSQTGDKTSNVTEAPAGGLAGGDTTDAGQDSTPLFDIDGPAIDGEQLIEETNPR
ncbi:MAG: hypothetical protein KY445_07110 [Armatimonadetes bacterium]|nr:hypothetical protein [Armatimonadota bacterium]